MQFWTELVSLGNADSAEVSLENKEKIFVGLPKEFGGSEQASKVPSPEELLLASVNGCIFTTFNTLTKKMGLSYISYSAKVEGTVELSQGKYEFVRIVVKPKIAVADAKSEKLASRCIALAEKYCLVSNSMKINIELEPEITIGLKM